MTIEARFWSKVDKNGPIPAHRPELGNCWVWTAGKLEKGYGAFALTPQKQVRAHRMAWMLTHGNPPKHNICHHCDNPPCCRPDHLFDGTHKDNADDRDRKGKGSGILACIQAHKDGRVPHARGESVHNSKLTAEQVIEMRRLNRDQGLGCVKLGKLFGVSFGAASDIIHKEVWKHLPDPPPQSTTTASPSSTTTQ